MPAYTVKSGVVNNSATAYNSGRKLARTSNGDLHCVWTDKRGDYYQIYYAKSTDGGQNWVETALTSENYYQLYPSIAIDSNDYIHITWCGMHSGSTTYYQIRYILNNGSWQSIENLTSGDYHQSNPSIAIDSNDYIHIAWYGKHSSSTSYNQIRYILNNGSWQSIENLTSAGDHQYSPGFIWANYPIISGVKTNRTKAGYAFVWTDCTDTNSVMYYESTDLDWDTPGGALSFSSGHIIGF